MKNIFKPLVLLFVQCLIFSSSQAQKDSTTIAKKNAAYVQIFGLGFTSINYDRVFLQKPRHKLAYRFGIETSPLFLNVTKRVVVLAEINMLFGNHNHFLETGIGFNTHVPTIKWPFDINIGPNVGYRFQKVEGGGFFRANMYPVGIHLAKSEQWVAGAWWWFGVSVGRSF